MKRDILKSLNPVEDHKNSFFPGSLKSRGSRAGADWSRAQETPGCAAVTHPLPPREVCAERIPSPRLPRPAGDHLGARQGGRCPVGSAGEAEEGAGVGAVFQLCGCCRVGFPGSLGGHKPGFPHPPAGQDGSGSAQSEAAVPAVCSYRDRVWLLCLQYSPKAKGTADLSGRPGTFLQAMMGKGSPAAAQGINSSLPASCLYSQPGSTVK